MNDTRQALADFTQRYRHRWQQEAGHEPESAELYSVPSPCVVNTLAESVQWQPQPFTLQGGLNAVERAMDITLREEAHDFWCLQFAGDMPARFDIRDLTLLQTWSEDDFRRVQENLIGHLVMEKRLKLSPTLFLATTEDEMEIISLCNLTGVVFLEKVGTKQREILAPTLTDFLTALHPRIS